jgi:uncharacterized delta-60 repeat protein
MTRRQGDIQAPLASASAIRHGLLALVFLATLAFAPFARANESPLDPSFGASGVVVTSIPGVNGVTLGLAEDHDGNLIAVGENDAERFAALRYSHDGLLDPSFSGGYVQTAFSEPAVARDVAVQANGRIVAAGIAGIPGGFEGGAFALARYRPDGTRDPSFSSDGRVFTPVGQLYEGGALALAIQSDGRILAAGFRVGRRQRSEGLLIRYLPNGAIDRSFGSSGQVRFATRGPGQATLGDVAVLPSGKILVAGGYHGRFLLARLLPNGHPDRSFGGGDGRVLTDVDGPFYCFEHRCASATSLALSHGEIVLAGNAIDKRGTFVALARYRANGKLDRRFGDRGVALARRGVLLEAQKMVVQPDGRIVVAALDIGYQMDVLRFLADGRPDPSFGRGGLFLHHIGFESAALTALVQRDGKVVIGGFASLSHTPPVGEEEEGFESTLTDARFAMMRFR